MPLDALPQGSELANSDATHYCSRWLGVTKEGAIGPKPLTAAHSSAGFDVGDVANDAVVDAALSTITGASFIASTVSRVIATRKLVT